MNVLVVEDDPIMREAFASMLMARQHSVIAVSSAEHALEKLADHTFSLILLDIVLPGMSGIELCHHIRSQEYGQMPVITAVTACQRVDDLQSILDAGADDFLAKPVDLKLFSIRLQIAENIAAKRREHHSLIDNNLMLSELVETLRDSVLIFDPVTAQIIEANKQACKELGYDKDELIRQTAFDISDNLIDSIQWNTLISRIKAHAPCGVQFEVSFKNRSGAVWPAELNCSIVMLAGSARVVTSARNHTQRKMLEHQLESARDVAECANQAKNEFLATITHELRTPLNAIVGFSELLATDARLPSLLVEQVQYIHQAGVRLQDMIGEILDYAELERGRLTAVSVPFNLEELINHGIAGVMRNANAKKLPILFQYPGQTPACFFNDPVRVKQILRHLLDNAVKFTPNGHIHIGVEVNEHREAAEPSQVTIAVTDTGIGIPEPKQHIIFDHFTQGDAGTTRLYGGTGIGLAIVTRLVHSLNGRVEMKSNVGEGTTFRIILPMKIDHQYPLEREQDTVHNPMLSGKLALIAASQQGVVEHLERLLKTIGMRTESVQQPQDCIRRLTSAQQEGTPFDFLIIGANCPRQDLEAYLQSIRAEPGLQQLLIVLETTPQMNERSHLLAKGYIHGYLTVPIEKEQFTNTLMTLWSAWHTGKPVTTDTEARPQGH